MRIGNVYTAGLIGLFFAGFSEKEWPRAWFEDSWEAGMTWSQNGFAEFKARRGYDLLQYLPELLGKGTSENPENKPRLIALSISQFK